jgi:hypothetical protein
VLGLDGGNGGVDILGNNVTTEHEARSHVLAVMRVALDNHGGGLEHSGGDIGNDGAEPIDGPLLTAEPTANEKSCALAARLNELDGVLGLDGGNGGVDILGNNVTTEHEARSHVLAVMRVALDNHGGGREHSGGDLGNDGAEPIDGPLLTAEPTANEKSCALAARLRRRR